MFCFVFFTATGQVGFLGSSDENLPVRVGKTPWRRELLPIPVVLPGEFHGQRSLEGYNSSWGHKESDTTESLTPSHRLSTMLQAFPGGSDGKESACNVGDLDSIPRLGRLPGEWNGYPLQYSCLENTQGQRSLAGYRPWGHKESDTTVQFSLSSTMLGLKKVTQAKTVESRV